MPFLNGLETARRLRKILPRVKIVFLTMHGDPTYVQEAIRAGASGYLVKDSAASELLIAVREVAMGRAYISSRVAKTVLSLAETGASESAVQLTSRQHEVLQLVAEGHANKEIAALLNISSKTVEFHKSALMKQLGVASTAELTRYAVRHGIADSA
jgi:DNA-binding NarL/FixJ family response regulator